MDLDLKEIKRMIEASVGGKVRLSRVLCDKFFHIDIIWNKEDLVVNHEYKVPMFEFKMLSCDINKVVYGSFIENINSNK